MGTHTGDLTPNPADQPNANWLKKSDLAPLGQMLWDSFRPLGPIAVHLLWFTQPGFALFGHADLVDQWVTWLEDPDAGSNASRNNS